MLISEKRNPNIPPCRSASIGLKHDFQFPCSLKLRCSHTLTLINIIELDYICRTEAIWIKECQKAWPGTEDGMSRTRSHDED